MISQQMNVATALGFINCVSELFLNPARVVVWVLSRCDGWERDPGWEKRQKKQSRSV